MGATATGSLKDAGQVIGLGSCAALVGDDGLGGGRIVGKGRGSEEKRKRSVVTKVIIVTSLIKFSYQSSSWV